MDLVLNMTGFVLNMAGFVLNMTGFVLNMTGFMKQNLTGYVPIITGFVKVWKSATPPEDFPKKYFDFVLVSISCMWVHT